jgi:hypothetical protein
VRTETGGRLLERPSVHVQRKTALLGLSIVGFHGALYGIFAATIGDRTRHRGRAPDDRCERPRTQSEVERDVRGRGRCCVERRARIVAS